MSRPCNFVTFLRNATLVTQTVRPSFVMTSLPLMRPLHPDRSSASMSRLRVLQILRQRFAQSAQNLKPSTPFPNLPVWRSRQNTQAAAKSPIESTPRNAPQGQLNNQTRAPSWLHQRLQNLKARITTKSKPTWRSRYPKTAFTLTMISSLGLATFGTFAGIGWLEAKGFLRQREGAFWVGCLRLYYWQRAKRRNVKEAAGSSWWRSLGMGERGTRGRRFKGWFRENPFWRRCWPSPKNVGETGKDAAGSTSSMEKD